MKKWTVMVMAMVAFMAFRPCAGVAQEAQPLGHLVALQGMVEVGRDGLWKGGRIDQQLFEGESIRTGAQSFARIVFQGELTVDVVAGAELKVGDLFFKARLGKLKHRVSSPDGTARTEMKVVPLTGVRGTEQEAPKSEDPRRPHFWSTDIDAPEGPGAPPR